jgi:phage terminase large subunit-like protein
MKKLLIITLLLLPLWTSTSNKTSLPIEFYAKWNDGTIKDTGFFLNLPKSRRDKISDSLYTAHYNKWVEEKYKINKLQTIKFLLKWELL